MKMCMHFKLIVKMGAGAEQEYTIEKEKKILNQKQPVSCPAQAPPAPFPSPLRQPHLLSLLVSENI